MSHAKKCHLTEIIGDSYDSTQLNNKEQIGVIRHMLFFAFKPSVDEEQRLKILAMLADLPRHFPEMRGFQLGTNVSKRDNKYSHGMTMSFKTLSDLEDYLNSERHEKFVRENFAPMIEERAIVSMIDQGN